MRKVTLAALVLSLSVPALAADLPSKAMRPAPVPMADWTGLYVGVHGGYGWGRWDGALSYDDEAKYPSLVFDHSDKRMNGNSWLAGLQIGANYQIGRIVFGAEADVSWTDLSSARTFLPYPKNPGSPAWEIENQLDMLGTVRGRLGFANGPVLVYATGGLAWGNVESNIQPVYKGGFVSAHGNFDETHIGYAIGGGVEWMLARNWTIKAEYLFIDLGKEDYAYVGTTVDGRPYDTDHYNPSLTIQTIRAGLNYKF